MRNHAATRIEGGPRLGIGAMAFPMLAQALLLGGHVRVGLEDNYYLDRGVKAPHNAALVEKAVRIMRSLGHEPATPAEARAILSITRRNVEESRKCPSPNRSITPMRRRTCAPSMTISRPAARSMTSTISGNISPTTPHCSSVPGPSVKEVMAPGTLDQLTKELIYVAVSVTNGCGYCIASHSAAAAKAGMTDAMFGELMSVVGMANETNRLANGYRVPIDPAFEK